MSLTTSATTTSQKTDKFKDACWFPLPSFPIPPISGKLHRSLTANWVRVSPHRIICSFASRKYLAGKEQQKISKYLGFLCFHLHTYTHTNKRKEGKQKSTKYQMISTRSGQRNQAAWGTKCENRKPDRSVEIGYKKNKKTPTHFHTHICTALGRGIITRQWTLPDTHMIYISANIVYMNLRSEFEYFSIVCFTSQAIKYIFVYYVDCKIGYTIFVQSLFVFTFAPFYNLILDSIFSFS